MAGKNEPVPNIRADGLQLEEHTRFQHAFWQMQRWVWLVYVILIAIALMGLTGAGGPLSQRNVIIGEADVAYPRVGRWQSPATLSVSLNAPADQAVIALSDDYASEFSLQTVTPQPESVEVANGWHIYRFQGRDEGPFHIVFDLEARKPGLARYQIRIGDQQSTLTTWIWP